MLVCPECSTALAADHTACPSCGYSLETETSPCEHCGEEIAADAPACPACGHLNEPTSCEAHPERRAEGQCAVCGQTVCAECNAAHGPLYLCPDHADVSVVEGWAQVYSTSNDIQAELIRENLQAEGIDARVLSQKDHYSVPVDIGDLSPVRVLVPAFSYQEAMDTIRSHMDAQGEVAFACPSCGEAYEAGAAECTACGYALA